MSRKNVKTLVAGNEFRKTRFHDEKGNLISLKNILTNGPHSLISTITRKTGIYRSRRPWIPYSAAREIEKNLNRESAVLEYGSGMSTLWLAKRCKTVLSIEDNEEWYKIVQRKLGQWKVQNIEYCFCTGDEYVSIPTGKANQYDFILLDGSRRHECIKTALPYLKSGGMVYLDDTDKDMVMVNRGMREAEEYLSEAVSQKGGLLSYFTDFSPGNFSVTQGALAKFP